MNDENQALLNKHRDILSLREVAPSTLASYTSYMKSYIEWVEVSLPGTPLNSVSWEEIRSYIRYLQNVRNLNNRTINVHMAQLRDFYYYVLKKDWDKREVPTLYFDEDLPRVPTREQVNHIIDTIPNIKHRAEIALLYSSGIRISELCRLHCGDIIQSKNCIYISKYTKKRSARYAVLSKKALDLLIEYIKECWRGATKQDWLFPGQKEGTAICTGTVYALFVHHLEKIGYQDMGFSPHSLRHAFGLHLYDAGVDLMSIKEALGHKSLSSTTIYVSLGIGNGRTVKSPYDYD